MMKKENTMMESSEMRFRYCGKCNNDSGRMVAVQHRFRASKVSAGQWTTIWNCLDCGHQYWPGQDNKLIKFKECREMPASQRLEIEELDDMRKEVARLRLRVKQADEYIERLLLG